MSAWRTWCLVVLVLSAALRPAAASDPAIPAGLRELEGHWVYAGGDQERQARLEAIDRTVRQMSFFIRFIARRMIRNATTIPSSYTISVHDHAVVVRKDDDTGFASDWSGRPVQIPGDQADTGTLTRVWKDGALRSRVQEPKGSGTEIMCPKDGGEMMSVEVIVASDHLPSEISFTLTYRKASDANAPQ